MSGPQAWVTELSEELPVERRAAVLEDALPVAAELARRLAARRRVERHRDELESELIYQLHATGVPQDLASSGSVARLRRWLATVGSNHLNALYRQERKEWSARQEAPPVEELPPPPERELQLDGVLSFGGEEEPEGPERPEEAPDEDEAAARSRLEPLLALARRAIARKADEATQRGNEARASLLTRSFEEVLALCLGRTTKQALLREQGIERAALDQRHSRARTAALQGLALLLDERQITPAQAARGRELLRSLVLVQR